MTRSRIKQHVLIVALASGLALPAAYAHADDTQVEAANQSFLHFEGVRSLGRLTRTQLTGRAPMVVTAGVRVYVPAREGLSKEMLSSLVQAELKHSKAGPLASQGLHARVLSADTGYIVELSVPKPSEARALVRAIEAVLGQDLPA